MMEATENLSPETERLFTEKAQSYVVCYTSECPLRAHCLRHILTHYVPQDQYLTKSINLTNPQMQRQDCPHYASDQPVRMPYGLYPMYHDMPGYLERAVKNHLISKYSRKRYYEYHNGTRPLTPEVEAYVRKTLKASGWTQEPVFLGYTTEYLW